MSRTTPVPFKVRPPTLEDAQAIADLIQAASLELGRKSRDSDESIRGLMNMPDLDLETDTLLVVDASDQILSCALLQEDPPNTMLSAMAEVHPKHRGKGIGTYLCGWIEERARQAILRAPDDARVAVLQKRSNQDKVSHDLLLKEGYQLVRHNFRMVIDMENPPPQPAIPEGIYIRPFLREKEGEILVKAMQETFQDAWGYVERPFELEYERWMYILDRDEDDAAQYWFVAMDGPEIVGFVLPRLQLSQDPEEAWIYIVGIRSGWRRRGIALALLQHTFLELYKQGKRKVSLEVDTQNPTGATNLYEKAGMRIEDRDDFFEKELRPGKE